MYCIYCKRKLFKKKDGSRPGVKINVPGTTRMYKVHLSCFKRIVEEGHSEK